MSLQTALKGAQDEMGKAAVALRACGLEIANAAAKGSPVGELNERFARTQADFEKHKATCDQLEVAIKAEQHATSISNPVRVVGTPASETHGATRVSEMGTDARRAVTETFQAYVRGGERSEEFRAALNRAETLGAISPSERHALLGTQGQLGGFLVPPDFRAEVIKNMAGYAVIRAAGARVVPTSSSLLSFPSITGGTNPFSTGVSGAWRAEGSQGTTGGTLTTQDQPTFGTEQIPVHVWQPNAIVITRELMTDSVVPLDSLLAQLLAETKAMDEDGAFLNGTGVGQPRGITDYIAAGTGPAITAVNSGNASAFTYNGLLDLMMTLPAQYRQAAVFILRSSALGEIFKLKDSSQMPILYQNALPDTLLGKKFYVSEQMAAVAGGAYPLVFGDMRYYCIAERQDLRIQRLEEKFAPNVGFIATARLGAGVLRTQAFVAQKISA